MNKFLVFAILFCTHGFALVVNSPEIGSARTKQVDLVAKKELVVTNNKWSSQAAYDILKKGGSAVDAAISAGFVLGLTEPQSSGIGGGGYALVYNKGKMLAYDGREVAPASANFNWFKKSDGTYMGFNEAHLTPYAFGIPGEVKLFYELHNKYGKLDWNKLLMPAIKLAKHGFPMSPRLYSLLMSESSTICLNPKIKKVYCDANGHVKQIGSLVVNKDYANTLAIIAKNPNDFYNAKIADDIIKTVNKAVNKNILNQKDFDDYAVVVTDPICITYRDKYKVCSIPPSSSGGVTILEMLKIYQKLYSGHNINDIKWKYNFLEASKLAFADRNKYIADPAYINNPVSGLLADEYINKRALLVKPNLGLKTPVKYGIPVGAKPSGADNEPKAHGTTSLIVVDKNKQVINMTVTIENQFGSHFFVDGFFLNNELTDFALNPYDNESMLVANRVESKKRPRSSIAPVLVLDQNNKLSYALGSPGGSQIICYVAKNFIQMVDFGFSPVMASSSDNLCALNGPVIIERSNLATNLLNQLQPLEQESIVVSDMVSGEVNVKFDGVNIVGAADPRREGVVLGK